MNNSENIVESIIRRNNISPYTNINNVSPETTNISPTANVRPTTPNVSPTTTNVAPAVNIRPTAPNVSPTTNVAPTANVRPTASNVSPTANVAPTANVSPTAPNVSPTANVSPITANVSPAADKIIPDNISPVTDKVSPIQDKMPAMKCPDIDFMPKNPRLAFAYVPYQKFKTTYSVEDSLKNGTAFPELHHPYPTDKKPYMCGPTGYYGGDIHG